MNRARLALYITLWCAGLFLLAALSGYSPFPPEGSLVDSRIAAMLTPVGIIESVILGHTPEGAIDLRPYYDQPMSRGGVFEKPGLILAYLLVLVGAIGGLREWRPFR